jgi:hypothetical protein
MNIQSMHYDFKRKLNKVDSQQYRNLQVPEIDWVLNEAIGVFIDIVAKNRVPSLYKGFEHTLKNTDDIRTMVVTDHSSSFTDNGDTTYDVVLPQDYLYFENGTVVLEGKCGKRVGRIFIEEHETDFLNSPFENASFEWGEVPGIFTNSVLKLYTQNKFTISDVRLSYIRKHIWVHNAANFVGGTYTLLDGTILTGTQDCELPEQTHKEIIDLAVFITANDIQTTDVQNKLNKLSLNNIVGQ